MKTLIPCLFVAASLLAPAASAVASEEMAKKYGCMACHAVDKKLIGPFFKEMAAKYKGQKDAEAKLVDKVKKGGTGVWGNMMMPPNTTVPDADVKILVKWILATK